MKKVKQQLSKPGKRQDGLTVLGSSARSIGLVLVSTLITEMVDLALERFLEKNLNSNGDTGRQVNAQSPDELEKSQAMAAEPGNLVTDSVSTLKERLGAVKPVGEELLHAARSQMGQFPPAITEFVDVLKDTVRQKLQETIGVTNQATQLVLENTGHAAQSVLDPGAHDAATPKTAKGKKPKKGKKKKRVKG